MSTRPEALRLADELDADSNIIGYDKHAAELRRLHQSEREGWRYAKELEHERKELSALLRQALEALEFHSAGHDIDEQLITALRERLGEKT